MSTRKAQTDHRGGVNGARNRLAPQTDWDVNVRTGVAEVLQRLEQLRAGSNTNISLADMIVLAGNVGIEMAAQAAGHDVKVPFSPGRTDAAEEMTEIDSQGHLEPTHDAFRNYLQPQASSIPAEHLMVNRAFLLNLSVPQMTALVGGMRAMGVNTDDSQDGVLTDHPGQLTNDFFVNLVDMGTLWKPIDEDEQRFVGRDRASGDKKWTASRVDLVFGSNSQLRAMAEEFAANGGEQKMLDNFVAGWVKVMVPGAGLEPARISTVDFESTASTDFATQAIVSRR